MPKIIRKFCDNRRSVFQGKRGLLSHPQSIDATVNTHIIISGIGIIIALAPIGFVVFVNQNPTRWFLTIKQYQVTLIKTIVFGTCNTNGHLRQVIGTGFGILFRQNPRNIAKNTYLIWIQATYINAHSL